MKFFRLITLVFIFAHLRTLSQDQIQFDYLFSQTGDTVLTFGGGLGDTSNFLVARRVGNTISYFDGFKILSNKSKFTVDDYPSDILKKYNLSIRGISVNADSAADFQIIQKVSNHKALTSSDKKTEIQKFGADLSLTIKVCNKTIIKNFKSRKHYEGLNKEDLRVNKSEVITQLIKMEEKPIYFFYVVIIDSFYESDLKVQHNKSVYQKGHIINCKG